MSRADEDHNDASLARMFASLRASEQERIPSFAILWEGAERAHRLQQLRRRARRPAIYAGGFGAIAALAASIALVFVGNAPSPEPTPIVIEAFNDEPLLFLLDPPGIDLTHEHFELESEDSP